MNKKDHMPKALWAWHDPEDDDNIKCSVEPICSVGVKYVPANKPPVDTIAVPREVLKGLREAIRQLESLGTCWQGQGVMGSQMFIIGTAVAAPCRELLATLDAVLAEGE